MSMTDRLTEGLLKVASKISNQRHMTAIKNAFTALLPIIITGAFCTLFSNVVCSTTTTGISLAKIDGFAWLEELTPLFTAANYATLNFFTIGTVVLIAIEMAKQLGHKETVAPVVAISAYVSLCDSFTKVAVEGVTDLVEVVNVLPREFTNAQGLFLGMIVAIVSMEIYCRLADSGKLAIKMPESVPSNVSSIISGSTYNFDYFGLWTFIYKSNREFNLQYDFNMDSSAVKRYFDRITGIFINILPFNLFLGYWYPWYSSIKTGLSSNHVRSCYRKY